MSRTYLLSSILLSAGWYPLLLLLKFHRIALVGALAVPSYLMFILIVVTGVFVSTLFYQRIRNAKRFENLILGAVLPYIGALIFLFLSGLISAFYQGGFNTLVAVMVYGMVFSFVGFYLIIPYGIVCQYLLQYAGRQKSTNILLS